MSRQSLRGIGSRLSAYNHGSTNARGTEKDVTTQEQSQEQAQSQAQSQSQVQLQSQEQSQSQQQQNSSPQKPSDGSINNTSTKRRRNILRRSNLVGSNAFGNEYNSANKSAGSQYGKLGTRVTSSGTVDSVSSSKASETIVIRPKAESDIDEYDYKTFSSGRPLRLSKVKAFEQAEVTMRLFYSREDEDEEEDSLYSGDEGHEFEYVKKSRGLSKKSSMNISVSGGKLKMKQKGLDQKLKKEQDEVITQLPDLSRWETAELLRKDSVASSRGIDEEENGENEVEMDENSKGGSLSRRTKSWFLGSNSEHRLSVMRNALKPLSEKELVAQRLLRSRLPKVFQNTGEFLNEMDIQEVECWEEMNEEFEEDMEKARRGGKEIGELRFSDAPFEALYGKEIDEELANAVVADIRRRVKEE
ncbi:DEKNAAC104168 [Brettanomyces naardenensis]|uniref:DEKNAAC104168 n=1 Tax=Brettanomyces naardenensis TaxID=13370 RepID=A0A448YPV5_BRENA|nr:DEKNAAC104168 [Brettanomyces naardenensis]